jgi:hypothetical protein
MFNPANQLTRRPIVVAKAIAAAEDAPRRREAAAVVGAYPREAAVDVAAAVAVAVGPTSH